MFYILYICVVCMFALVHSHRGFKLKRTNGGEVADGVGVGEAAVTVDPVAR